MAFNGIDSPDRPMREFREKTIESLSIPPFQTDESDDAMSEKDVLLCRERLELSSPTLWPEPGEFVDALNLTSPLNIILFSSSRFNAFHGKFESLTRR